MYLHLFRKDVFPGWDESRKIAESVVGEILDKDEELSDHIAQLCKRYEMNSRSKERSGSAEKSKTKQQPVSLVSDERLKKVEHFVNLIYSWISEGFVGVLDSHGVLFVWDQLMMFGWNKRVIANTALAIIMLLRHRALEAFDFEGLKEVSNSHKIPSTQIEFCFSLDFYPRTKRFIHSRLTGSFCFC